jgi:multidrug transporter EmrE-like cation transporter
MRTRALYAGAFCCLVLFVFAFVAAPHACEWGLSAYFWSGLACLGALVTLPFVMHERTPVARRAGLALALAGLGCATWVTGLFAANVRIMCRLF